MPHESHWEGNTSAQEQGSTPHKGELETQCSSLGSFCHLVGKKINNFHTASRSVPQTQHTEMSP